MILLNAQTLISVILTSVVIVLVNGHSNGAQEESCDTMTVNHDNTTAQTKDPNYMIMLSATIIDAGDTVQVWIMSNYVDDRFKGLLLKAIDSSQSDLAGVAGSFVLSDDQKELYHTLSCSDSLDSAVTHSSSEDKAEVTFDWKAPSTNGTYVFVMSVVVNHDTYWEAIRSDEVEVIGAGHVITANLCAIFVVALATMLTRL